MKALDTLRFIPPNRADDKSPSLMPMLIPSFTMCLEFGVSIGRSTRRIAEAIYPRTLYAFDSFEGLPEQWGNQPKGAFKASIPELPKNVSLVIGLFQDTLPKFLKAHPKEISFVHIDCDLYSSTKFVLDQIGPRLTDDAMIYFDEIYGTETNIQHEGRAFEEWLDETGFRFACICRQHPFGAGFYVWRGK